MNPSQQPAPDHAADTADTGVAPPRCPTCHAPRTWEIDPSETDAEWFMWCEPCADGEFPSEAGA